MKAYLIANISSKGLTHIGWSVKKFQSFEKKKCFFSHRAIVKKRSRYLFPVPRTKGIQPASPTESRSALNFLFWLASFDYGPISIAHSYTIATAMRQ
jgi:hypothetical protein